MRNQPWPVGGPEPTPYLNWTRSPELHRPVIVAAFEGWNDAGDAATTAVRHLRDHTAAATFASIDAEDFFDFTSTRPTIHIEDGSTRRVQWPEIELSCVGRDEVGTDLIMLIGAEPQLKWRTFCEQVLNVARHTDARLVVTLGALLAEVPHSRPTNVMGTSYDDHVAEELGLQSSSYEGPTGIVGVLHYECIRAGIPSVSLWAAVPSYLPGASSPKAALALIERITDLLGVRVPTLDLEIAAASYERQVNALVEEDDETEAYVRQLEAHYDDEQTDEPLAVASSADGLVEEVEEFLRRQG